MQRAIEIISGIGHLRRNRHTFILSSDENYDPHHPSASAVINVGMITVLDFKKKMWSDTPSLLTRCKGSRYHWGCEVSLMYLPAETRGASIGSGIIYQRAVAEQSILTLPTDPTNHLSLSPPTPKKICILFFHIAPAASQDILKFAVTFY